MKLSMPGMTAKQFFTELVNEINEDDIFNGAAALGFYLTLAIFPAVIFLMALLPYLPIPGIDAAIIGLLREALPGAAAEMFVGVVQDVTTRPRGGLLSFGFLATLWATSSGMNAVMQQLNVTYDVTEARGFVRSRLLAIGLTVLFALLFIAGLSLTVLGALTQDWLDSRYTVSPVLSGAFAVFRWVVIVLMLLFAFALVYYMAPNVKQKFVFVTPGSVLGVLVLMVASLGFGWYATNFGDYDATYGSIGAVIVLMLWLYIAGLTVLCGSEVNALIEHHSREGKEKGERVEGEKERDPAVAERAREAEPERAG